MKATNMVGMHESEYKRFLELKYMETPKIPK